MDPGEQRIIKAFQLAEPPGGFAGLILKQGEVLSARYVSGDAQPGAASDHQDFVDQRQGIGESPVDNPQNKQNRPQYEQLIHPG
ncbi:hypothetical protein ES708_10652 [subsurface metagenome]